MDYHINERTSLCPEENTIILLKLNHKRARNQLCRLDWFQKMKYL